MIISSHNEYGVLRSVIVGRATNANFPAHDALLDAQMLHANWKDTPFPKGPVSEKIINEANEDLDALAKTLEAEGVKVYRPDEEFDHTARKVTVDWTVDGQYSYCPRDTFLVLGGEVIETPMSTRARVHENMAYTAIKREAMKTSAKWYAAPQPRLLYNENVKYNRFKLTEEEPVFDAANVCRLGYDLLYLVSSSANYAGAKWLQNQVGCTHIVHVIDMYDAAHIDSTIVPISEDTVVLNASRVNEDNVPAVFDAWNKLYITEDMIVPQDFDNYPYASKWIAINMLALGNNKVICDKNQPKIIKMLEDNGFIVIPQELRHSRTLGGGFHCVTLDLQRD